MDNVKVKDLMIPLGQYATVHEDATLFEAVLALESSQERFAGGTDPSRAVLVVNSQGHVVGKVSQLDVIRSLEPSYNQILEKSPGTGRLGFSARFLKNVAQDYRLWDKPLEDICCRAGKTPVKSVMYAPDTEGEYVHEEAPIDEAIHQVVMGHHQSLLVIRRGRITGILRLTDVFRHIARRMHACGFPEPEGE